MDAIVKNAPLAMQAGGTALSAYGQYDQASSYKRIGARQMEAAEYEAQQLEQNAGQQQAAAQRAATEERRMANLAASRALAVAAASGGASDPTVVNLMARIQGEGAYRSMMELYGGEDRARLMRAQAASTRRGGQMFNEDAQRASKAAKFGAFSTVMKGSSSLYEKYGKKGRPEPIQQSNPYGFAAGDEIDRM